jgi:hypothetical protein
MMRRVLLLLALISCGGDTEKMDKRLDDLEHRVNALTETVAASKKAYTARGDFEKVRDQAAKLIFENAQQLAVAGIFDEKLNAVTRWWCFNAFCARTAEECEIGLAQFRAKVASIRDVASKARDTTCAPSRIAFCSPGGCAGTLQGCELLTGHPKECRGVE